MDLITLKAIKKVYGMGDIEVDALRGINLNIKKGEFVAIMGASGSGKSTLMNILGCLDCSSEGSYWLEGIVINDLSKRQLAAIRNQKIGFVFQEYNLLSRTSALENVELPLLYNRTKPIKEPKKRAMYSLEKVGLGERFDHEPNQLSGGQRQRVAIARALVNQPSIILADEPTGNLDSKTSVEIISLFQKLNEQGITVVLVTHEHDIAAYARHIIELKDGMIINDRND